MPVTVVVLEPQEQSTRFTAPGSTSPQMRSPRTMWKLSMLSVGHSGKFSFFVICSSGSSPLGLSSNFTFFFTRISSFSGNPSWWFSRMRRSLKLHQASEMAPSWSSRDRSHRSSRQSHEEVRQTRSFFCQSLCKAFLSLFRILCLCPCRLLFSYAVQSFCKNLWVCGILLTCRTPWTEIGCWEGSYVCCAILSHMSNSPVHPFQEGLQRALRISKLPSRSNILPVLIQRYPWCRWSCRHAEGQGQEDPVQVDVVACTGPDAKDPEEDQGQHKTPCNNLVQVVRAGLLRTQNSGLAQNPFRCSNVQEDTGPAQGPTQQARNR